MSVPVFGGQSLEKLAAIEHPTHISDIASIQMAHVEVRQLAAVLEHLAHICHIVGVQMLDPDDVLKVLHVGEPIGRGRWAGVVERGVEDDVHDEAGAAIIPFGL